MTRLEYRIVPGLLFLAAPPEDADAVNPSSVNDSKVGEVTITIPRLSLPEYGVSTNVAIRIRDPHLLGKEVVYDGVSRMHEDLNDIGRAGADPGHPFWRFKIV